MSRKLGILLLLPLLAACVAAPHWGARVLQRIAWFEVDRVEISGTLLLAPDEVLTASGIRLGDNIWDELRAWEEALRRHPVIADVRVSRRLPRTLRIRVEEERPVALVEERGLRLATAAGILLPLDPARVPLDLPLLRARQEEEKGEEDHGRRLLAETGRMAQLDPGLWARVSEVSGTAQGELLLLLSYPAVEVLLLAGATPRRLRQLRAVLEELERSTPSPERPLRVDARFEDQVVVRF